MPRQKNSEPHVVIRRRKVASMLLRRMNALELTELTEALSQGRNATFNPHTKQLYSHPTITRDINALLDRWQEESSGRLRPDEGQAPLRGSGGQARGVLERQLQDVDRLVP